MKKLFISSRAEQPAQRLRACGYDVRLLPPSPLLPPPVSCHADMLLFPLNGSLLVCRNYYEKNRDIFTGVPVRITDEEHGYAYPHDIILNAFTANGALYGKIGALSHVITDYCAENGVKTVNVRQGYAGCSVLLTEKFAVTSDAGIAEALREGGVDTLRISPGGIALQGYGTGFIGGASFVDGGRVFFFGDIKTHPDSDALYEYFGKYQTEAVCLSDGVLTDFGGARLCGDE